ncbi:MAG: FAD-dependent monooxygenase [Pseudomonadota bacterium]
MPKVLIAGGGIAGMAAAIALARLGWEVQLFESAPALGEVGAGLQMSPNACKALRDLGVLPDVAACATRPGSAVMRDGATGRVIFQAPLGDAAKQRWGAPYLHVHRADLLEVLAAAAARAGVSVHLGQAAETAVTLPTEVSLHLANGTAMGGDLLIGADGIRSSLRAGLNPDEAPRFTGQIAWRALIPAERVAGADLARDATVWSGPGQHLVSYYLRDGSLINLVAVAERPDWTEESWSAPGDAQALRAAFAGWHPTVTALLACVEDCFLWGLFDRPEQVRWTEGRLALIGDAAHPMLPFMAQGAAMALEDAVSLARHLQDAANIPRTLTAWEEARWSRVARVQRQSRANGRLYHRGGLGRVLTHTPIGIVSRLAPGVAAGQLDWLYGYDPGRP